MNYQIKIRRANEADAQLLSHLGEITFVETFAGTCTDEDMQSFVNNVFEKDILANELKDENDFYFIAFTDEIPAGYMRLKEDYTDYPAMQKYKSLELKRIYVLKEFHLKKIGAALMEYAVQFAHTKNYEVLWLGVWEHNYKAQDFYKKWGFNDTGCTHNFPIGNTPQTDNWLIKFIAEEHKGGISL